MNFPFRYGINSLLLNNRGEKFADSEFIARQSSRARAGGRTPPWFELDCARGKRRRAAAALHGKERARSPVMAALGSRSAVLFDLDGDGDLDIVTNEFNSAPQVLVSDLAQKKKIRLAEGRASSARPPTATGSARPSASAPAGSVFTKWNDGKSGYLSQSALPLYFGLGDAASIEAVEVDWPSGRKQVVSSGFRMNSTLRIAEPK